jgi:hypothetical protein
MQAFKPRIETLPEPQQKLWREMGSTPKDFVLYGGTALALQLAHRQSEDFDFFSSKPFSHDELLHGVSYLKGAVILQQEVNTLTCAVDRGGEIKVSFLGALKLGRVQGPLQSEGTNLRVASMLDIAATKLGLIQRRPYYRDYFDIYTMLEAGVSLAHALGAAQTIHGRNFDPKLSVKALAFFDDGDLQRLPDHMKKRLATEAQKINIGRLPQIKAWTEEIDS